MPEKDEKHAQINYLEVEENSSRPAARQNGNDAVAHNQHKLNHLKDCDEWLVEVQIRSNVLVWAEEIVKVHDDVHERVDWSIVNRHEF